MVDEAIPKQLSECARCQIRIRFACRARHRPHGTFRESQLGIVIVNLGQSGNDLQGFGEHEVLTVAARCSCQEIAFFKYWSVPVSLEKSLDFCCPDSPARGWCVAQARYGVLAMEREATSPELGVVAR